MVSLSSSSQFSMDTMFADGGFKLLTDGELLLLIQNLVEKFRSESANESGQPRENFIGSDFQADCNVPSSSSDVVSRSLNSFKDGVYKQILNAIATQRCTPKAAQPPEDLLNKRKDCSDVQTEAAGSSATKEDTRMSAVTCEDVTETCPGLPRSCSLSQEEHKSQLDVNKNLGNGSQMFEVSVELGMQKKEKNLGINTVQDINSNNTEDQHDTYRKTFCSILRDPQYEDISDYEDKSKLVSSELYEDVSEDENQCIQTSAELSGLDEVQIKNQIPETKTRYCRSPLLQSEGLETNISCSVFKDKQELDNQHDDDDDNEEEDNWDVMSLSISNNYFEDKNDGECGGKTSLSFKNARLGNAPNPVPASAFSQMEVFDTPAQQERAVKCGQVSFVVPSSSSNHQQTSNLFGSTEELCSEAEDSCETDYSSDYSSGSESNYLTVSKQLVRNLSSSSLTNSVRSDSERKNRGNRTKNFQKSSNEDVIVCIDSDDENDDGCVNETKNTKSSRNSEYSGTCPSNKAEPLKGLDPATAQLQGRHTETTNLCQGTAKGSCAINKQTNSDDDVIIILSDSDDDIIELGVEVMTPSLISVNSDFWHKEPTVDKEIPQGLKQSSAESSEPRPESSWDKPGTSRLIPPGEISFPEPTRKVKDHTRKRVPSSETEEANVDDDLNNAENGLCTKKKKVKLSEASGSLGPVIPRLLVQVSPRSGEQVQLVHESAVQSRETDLLSSNSSSVGSHSDSFRKKSRYSTRDETGKCTSKLKCPKKVHNTPESKVDRSSFEPKRHASSLKGHPPYSKHSSSRPPFPLRSSSSFSASTQSVEQTNHARRKVFSDWRKNHVPLRRERKARGANYLRKSV